MELVIARRFGSVQFETGCQSWERTDREVIASHYQRTAARKVECGHSRAVLGHVAHRSQLGDG
jgi:hypothetical protein